MKKQYSRRRNALITRRSLTYTFGVGGLAVLFFLLRTFAPGVLTTIAKPGWQLGASAAQGTHTVLSLFGNIEEITRERDRLIEENQTLTNTNRALQGQIVDLTHLVGTRPESAHHILAGVLARPPVSPYDTLTLDVGSNGGVKEGALVFGPGNVPVGTVELVTQSTSRVSLFSTPGRVTDGWVGEKKLAVTLTGASAGAFTAILTRDSGVAVGDVLYLPGPGALPAGSIIKIDTDPSSPHDVVHIVPYTNIFSLTWVEVAP
jgi:cell shape-determining protein MreC